MLDDMERLLDEVRGVGDSIHGVALSIGDGAPGCRVEIRAPLMPSGTRLAAA